MFFFCSFSQHLSFVKEYYNFVFGRSSFMRCVDMVRAIIDVAAVQICHYFQLVDRILVSISPETNRLSLFF